MFGALVATATLPVRNVLPGVVRKIGTSVGEGFWLGRYTVYLRAKYGDAGQELYSQEKALGGALADAGMEVASRIGARCLGDCGA